jgi:hypothetical protein
MAKVVKITDGLYVGNKSRTMFEVVAAVPAIDTALTYTEENSAQLSTNVDRGKKYANWGENNDFPFQAMKLFSKNPITMNALNFKIKAHYGKGVRVVKKVYDKGKEILEMVDLAQYPEIEDFFYENAVNEEYVLESVTDCEWFINIFPEFILNKGRTKINRIRHNEAANTRMGLINPKTGLPDYFYIADSWPNPKDEDIQTVPGYNPKNPTANPKFIQQFCQPSIGKAYYQLAYWLGSETWVKVQNKVPELINSFIENQMNLKYHVQIPFSYFDKLIKPENYGSNEAYLAAYENEKTLTMDGIDEQLSGPANSGKNLFSMYGIDDDGKPVGEWKITVIDSAFKHDAYMNMYETSSSAVASAHNVPPALAGILFPGKMGAGSGAEIRESFNHYVQLHTQIPRKVTLSPFRFIHRFNKWPRELDYIFEDIDLHVPLNVTKSGLMPVQPQLNPVENAIN